MTTAACLKWPNYFKFIRSMHNLPELFKKFEPTHLCFLLIDQVPDLDYLEDHYKRIFNLTEQEWKDLAAEYKYFHMRYNAFLIGYKGTDSFPLTLWESGDEKIEQPRKTNTQKKFTCISDTEDSSSVDVGTDQTQSINFSSLILSPTHQQQKGSTNTSIKDSTVSSINFSSLMNNSYIHQPRRINTSSLYNEKIGTMPSDIKHIRIPNAFRGSIGDSSSCKSSSDTFDSNISQFNPRMASGVCNNVVTEISFCINEDMLSREDLSPFPMLEDEEFKPLNNCYPHGELIMEFDSDETHYFNCNKTMDKSIEETSNMWGVTHHEEILGLNDISTQEKSFIEIRSTQVDNVRFKPKKTNYIPGSSIIQENDRDTTFLDDSSYNEEFEVGLLIKLFYKVKNWWQSPRKTEVC